MQTSFPAFRFSDPSADWAVRFAVMARRIPRLGRTARPTLLGFSAFVDACVSLDGGLALFADTAPAPARRLAAELVGRIAQAKGGEIDLGWPEGDIWLSEHLPHRIGAGGTSAQVAKALALLGAPTLLALADRSADQRAVLHGAIGLADTEGVRRLADVAGTGAGAKARHWIFEATEGAEVGGLRVRRSTRVITRLKDDAPEDDPAFARESVRLAPGAGAAAISSLVSTPDALLARTLARIGDLARRWRAAGLGLVHLELADYGARPAMPRQILDALRGGVTSVGMSQSEWATIAGGDPTPDALRGFAEASCLERLCLHADDWALTVTRGDPAREAAALVAGCLLAAARAAAGQPVVPAGLPPGAVLGPVPPSGALGGGWSAVGCPAPHLARPASTIGLGDTFLAGSLLVLGQPAGIRFDEGDQS